ncbi:DnaJ homolog subfamily C member 4 [Anthophora plagiata]
MAQISRVYKYEIPILIRVLSRHNNQRREHTYYEVLRIPTNATQKEIRDAYIKMSKDLHPDNSRKGNHADFVKINEAYNVLSKAKTRHYYDMDLKYNSNNNSSSSFSENNGYHNAFKQWEIYEMYYEQNKKSPSIEDRRKAIKFCATIVILGVLVHVVIVIQWSKYNMRAALEKSAKLQLNYEQNKKENRGKTLEEQMQQFTERYKKLVPNYKDDD